MEANGPCSCVPGSLKQTNHGNTDAASDVHLSFTYPSTNSPILIQLRVLADPTRNRRRVIAMHDIPGNFFIGTLSARVSAFQLRHVNGLLLRTPQGGYLIPVEGEGLHCIAPAGREVDLTAEITDGAPGPKTGFVLCPELANVRIAWNKRICGGVHPAFYTTRYIHAGEELMVNIDGECLASFLRRRYLVLKNSADHRIVDRQARKSLGRRWRCIEDADGNPFLVK
jgi:hypothetical protein